MSYFLGRESSKTEKISLEEMETKKASNLKG